MDNPNGTKYHQWLIEDAYKRNLPHCTNFYFWKKKIAISLYKHKNFDKVLVFQRGI